MVSAGALIWISCRPLIRLIFCTTCGFVITKMDIFPAVAARGAGQVLLNIALPCLLFSKIVPAVSTENLNTLGPLIFVALLYEGLGIAMAWTTKQFFWVPHQFRYGILVAGGWGNVGDIPTAVSLSVMGAAPFAGTQDQNLSIAYIAVFILVFMVTLFPLGGHKWISMDYVGPDVEPEEIREKMRLKHKRLLRPFRQSLYPQEGQIDQKRDEDIEKRLPPGEEAVASSAPSQKHVSFVDHHDDAATTIVQSYSGDIAPYHIRSRPPTEGGSSRIDSLERTSTIQEIRPPSKEENTPVTLTNVEPTSDIPSFTTSPASFLGKVSNMFRNIALPALRGLCSPPSLAILIAFPLAMVPKLKALFVFIPASPASPTIPLIPFAPDGQPPLAFILDTATFVGGASIPLGLICLGSALARLQIPRKGEWTSLPRGAIMSMAIGRMLVMPVLGVCMCQGLTKAGVIEESDKVLRFVCILFSCLPTATTQVFLTQIYSGTGSAEHLSAFLIPQYALMLLSMTALTAFTIQLLF